MSVVLALALFVQGAMGQTLSFTSKLNGKTRVFKPDSKRVLVRMKETRTQGTVDTYLQTHGIKNAQFTNAEKRVAVVQLDENSRGSLDSLETGAVVEPLYVDQDGYPQYWVSGEYTVQLRTPISDEKAAAVLKELGAKVVTKQRTPGYYTLEIPKGKSILEAVRAANAHAAVEFSEPSTLSFEDALWEPNDEKLKAQWHLLNTGQFEGKPGADIKAKDAWEVTKGNPNVVIAIVDSGINEKHPDLAEKILPQGEEDWNFEVPTEKIPTDKQGHGTSCAGLAAGATDNKIGIAGVCPRCRILPLKVDLASGKNQSRADAINYAVEYQKKHPELRLILSSSWRMSSGAFDAVEKAFKSAFDAGIPCVVASGNSNGKIDFPAAYPSVMAIGGSSPCDERKSPKSCDKESWGANYGDELFLVAPSAKLLTTSMNGGYSPFNGTSSATPISAGVIGLMLSLNQELTLEEVKDTLAKSADDEVGPKEEDPPGKDKWMGWGRINAKRTVDNTRR